MKERRGTLKFLADNSGRGRRSSSASAEEKQTSEIDYTSWQTRRKSGAGRARLRSPPASPGAVYSNFYASRDICAAVGGRLGFRGGHSAEGSRVRHLDGGRQATAGEPVPGQGLVPCF